MNETIKPIEVARKWFTDQLPDYMATAPRIHSLSRLISSERAAERERCAKVSQEIAKQQERDYGSANSGGADDCVAAIRALK